MTRIDPNRPFVSDVIQLIGFSAGRKGVVSITQPKFIQVTVVDTGGFLDTWGFKDDVLGFLSTFDGSPSNRFRDLGIHPHRDLAVAVKWSNIRTFYIGEFSTGNNVFAVDDSISRDVCLFTPDKLFIRPVESPNRLDVLNLDTFEWEDSWFDDFSGGYEYNASQGGYLFSADSNSLWVYDWVNRSLISSNAIPFYDSSSELIGGPSARPNNTCVIVRGNTVYLFSSSGIVWSKSLNLTNPAGLFRGSHSVSQDFLGNIYIAEDSFTSDAGLYKLDSDGNFLWHKNGGARTTACFANNAGRIITWDRNSKFKLWSSDGDLLSVEENITDQRIVELHPGRYGMFGF